MLKQIKQNKDYSRIRDIYYIDETGKVFSKKSGKTRELKLKQKTCGYLYAYLMRDDKKVDTLRVHRIVAKLFLEKPSNPNRVYVNHIDENKTNNNVSNLEWVTPKENNLHSLRKALYAYNEDGSLFKEYYYTKECVEDGFNQGHACSCARGEIRSHKKKVFSYVKMTRDEVVQRLSKSSYKLNWVEYTQVGGNSKALLLT